MPSMFFIKHPLTCPYCPLVIQKIVKILRAVLEKNSKSQRHTLGHLILYSMGLRIFLKSHLAQTMSILLCNNVKKIERSLEPFWRKGGMTY